MKQNWVYKKLGDVCEVLNGYAFKSQEYVDHGIRVIRITNVQKGYVVDDDPKFYPLSSESTLSNYMLAEDDLLMSLTGNVGRVGLLGKEFLPAALNQRVACLRIKSACLDKKFLFHILNSDKFEKDCIFNAAGIAQKNMSTRWLSEYAIPVPPMSEQSRIVAELDLLTGIIDKQKAQLKELDNLAQSIFYDMFGDPIENPKGWDVKKLGEVSNVKIGPFGSLLHARDYISGGHPVINPVHLKAGRVVAENDFTVNDEMYAEMMSYVLRENDIIFGRRGDIGRCALVTKEQDGFLCGTGSLFVRFSIQIQPLFSIVALMQKGITDFLLDRAKGATMLNINCGIVEDIPIVLPPLKLQQEFADKITAIESQKSAINQSMAETQKLLDYTMDKYFG